MLTLTKRLHALTPFLFRGPNHLRSLRTDTTAGGSGGHRRRHKSPPLPMKKLDDRSEWWIVDGEMHEIGEQVPLRERFVIPRENIPNKRRKQLREQFMRRTRLVIKESEHDPWCKKYMELYNELRENWERLYWEEGYSKKLGQDHANYESAEDDNEDFSPYRSRRSPMEHSKYDPAEFSVFTPVGSTSSYMIISSALQLQFKGQNGFAGPSSKTQAYFAAPDSYLSQARYPDSGARNHVTVDPPKHNPEDSSTGFAKRKLDDSVFLGNRLQVSYAPQFESHSDTKDKLEGRRREVLARLNPRRSKETTTSSSRPPIKSEAVAISSQTSCLSGNLGPNERSDPVASILKLDLHRRKHESIIGEGFNKSVKFEGGM
ncbi:hypothetical protein TanjilG_25304 [Lupinus angustifolius]|uniref:Uncharacterized protein n=1 Tax=Lupinus angustifolius TaxID=3871 RepID=A0A4P1RW16_LUPAN|nr:hypothetical protein TanjilG_25304 [Lupinus angustifolius]